MRNGKLPPAFNIVIPFILGIIAGKYFNPHYFLLLIASLVLMIVLIIGFILKSDRVYWLTAVLLFVTFGALLYQQKKILPADNIGHFADTNRLVSVEGVICSPVSQTDQKCAFALRPDSVWYDYMPFPASGNIRITIKDNTDNIQYGDRIIIRGLLTKPPDCRNPGEFNYRQYLEANGIYAQLSAQNNNLLVTEHRNGNPFLFLVYKLRANINSYIDRVLNDQQGALLKGLLTGAREDIDDEIRESFANAGIVHILAVSGLHTGFILLGLTALFSIMRLPVLIKTILTIAGLALFAALTGGAPPVVRAVIMCTVYLVAPLVNRRSHALNTLSISAFIILAINPLQLFQTSFQFSFTAVCGIVFIYQKLMFKSKYFMSGWYEKELKLPIYAIELFYVSLAAQLAALPLSAYYFGVIPVLSIFVNLVIVPLAGIVVGIGFLGIILGAIYFQAGVLFLNADWLYLKGMVLLTNWVNTIPFSYVRTPRPSLILIACYVLFLFLIFILNKTWQKRAFIVILLLLTLLTWKKVFTPPVLTVTFFDVGQGDASLFRFPDGKTLLIDTGDKNEDFDYGERVIAPFLRRQNIHKINTLLLTHSHSDHIGGASYLMRNFSIGRLVQSPGRDSSSMQYTVDSLAAAFAIPSFTKSAGDTLDGFCNTLILVLSPNNSGFSDNIGTLNNTSLVLKLVYYNTTILMTGDAEIPAEEQMLRFGHLLKSDVLKAAHHGSQTAGSKDFLQRVSPEYVVVSVGKHNRFGLPSESLMNYFTQAGVHVLRTDHNGAIIFKCDKTGIKKVYTCLFD